MYTDVVVIRVGAKMSIQGTEQLEPNFNLFFHRIPLHLLELYSRPLLYFLYRSH